MKGRGDGDAEQGVARGKLVRGEFEVDEGFDERAGRGLGKVDDGTSGAVPAPGVAEAALAGEVGVGADAPQIACGGYGDGKRWAQAKKPLWIWPSISSTRRPPISVRSMSMGVRPSKRCLG